MTELLHDALNPLLSERIRDGGELLDRLKAMSTCYADADRLVSAAFAVDSDARTQVENSFETRRTP